MLIRGWRDMRIQTVICWRCWACRTNHFRQIPLGCPKILSFPTVATCAPLSGTHIIVTDGALRCIPEEPILTEWDALKYIAKVKPAILGGVKEPVERPAYSGVEYGWSDAP